MKNLRKLAVVCTFLFVIVAVVSSVYGISGSAGDLKNALGTGNASGTITGKVGGIWATVSTVVQILAVAAVVFAGVRYMFASADAKADIKKQTVILIVGAVLVFGATFILGIVSSTTNELLE